jgi:hypothetical protein
MTTLAPWANGPFELIVHAEEHLRSGDDFDRRIALISFDDAIEVAITTYLTLHPIQRGNRNYSRVKRDEWLQNFHTKLDFLNEELASRSLMWEVDRTHIVWAHENRNEQYHGGKKETPEKAVLAIVRKASIWGPPRQAGEGDSDGTGTSGSAFGGLGGFGLKNPSPMQA